MSYGGGGGGGWGGGNNPGVAHRNRINWIGIHQGYLFF